MIERSKGGLSHVDVALQQCAHDLKVTVTYVEARRFLGSETFQYWLEIWLGKYELLAMVYFYQIALEDSPNPISYHQLAWHIRPIGRGQQCLSDRL